MSFPQSFNGVPNLKPSPISDGSGISFEPDVNLVEETTSGTVESASVPEAVVQTRSLTQGVVDAREHTAEAIRELSVRIMRLNHVRSIRNAAAEAISDAAMAMRDQEKAVEELLGAECEAWMAYYLEHGLPGAENVSGETTPAAIWRKVGRDTIDD